MILNGLPPELQPIVSVVDDWSTNRRLGLVVEAQVGRGRLLMCSIDLSRNLESRPVARQLRHSLIEYLAGDVFPALRLRQPARPPAAVPTAIDAVEARRDDSSARKSGGAMPRVCRSNFIFRGERSQLLATQRRREK